MKLDADLITSALRDVTRRPAARAHLQAFLAAGGSPNQRLRIADHSISLLVAAEEGWEEVLEDLLDADQSFNLLYAAVDQGWEEVVEDLLAAGADVHADGDGPLRRAVINRHLRIVERLLAAGADVHANGGQVLYWAVDRDHLPIVECLLAAGADVHANGDRALEWAVQCEQVPIVECLLAAGADAHVGTNDPLRWAAARGHLRIVERLLAAGADVHACHDEALRRASAHGHLPIVERLLAAGASAVEAWKGCAPRAHDEKRMIARNLDACAAMIPAEQRHAMLDMARHRFPALRAFADAEQRSTAMRHSLRPRRAKKP